MLFLKKNKDYSTIYNFVKENSFDNYWYEIIEERFKLINIKE